MNPSLPNSESSPDDKRTGGAASSWQKSFQIAAPYLGLGMQMVLTMVLFVAAGHFLDGRLGTAPWLLLAGALLGMVVLFVYLLRLAGKLSQKNPAPPTDETTGRGTKPS